MQILYAIPIRTDPLEDASSQRMANAIRFVWLMNLLRTVTSLFDVQRAVTWRRQRLHGLRDLCAIFFCLWRFRLSRLIAMFFSTTTLVISLSLSLSHAVVVCFKWCRVASISTYSWESLRHVFFHGWKAVDEIDSLDTSNRENITRNYAQKSKSTKTFLNWLHINVGHLKNRCHNKDITTTII